MLPARAVRLTNPVRHYPWGSRTVLPALLGRAVPAEQPWAEIWMGAHPLDPSYLPDGSSLADVEPALPFLVKLLAAEDPLSVQAHPNRAQAQAGHDAEDARGLSRSDPDRSYKDTNHKPELFIALEDTQALCGFRSPKDIVETADRLGSAAFSNLVVPAAREADQARALREILTRVLHLEGQSRSELLDEVTRACRRRAADGRGDGHSADADATAAAWVVRLDEHYPADGGVLAPLLLDLVALAPGEALFVDAGVLHAYLHGAGVEVQASSDNVLRGGLTGKHVDVDELLRVVRFEEGSGHRVRPRPVRPGLEAYDVPVEDFAVWRVQPAGLPVAVPAVGPTLVLCVDGWVEVGGTQLEQGAAAYVPRDGEDLVVTGTGTCFVTSPGQV